MDVFEASDFSRLVPRKVIRRVATAVALLALLFPTQFRDWYTGQIEQHARHLTAELLKACDLSPTTPEPETKPGR